jgi:hypothetical protein
MPDLKDVEARIAELKAEIEPTQREIEALEAIARGLKALGRGERVSRAPERDYSKMTMPEAAEAVLTEHFPLDMHYSRVAKLAVERGFKGKRIKPGSTALDLAPSFRRMMAQRPDIFIQRGRGVFVISKEHLDKTLP